MLGSCHSSRGLVHGHQWREAEGFEDAADCLDVVDLVSCSSAWSSSLYTQIALSSSDKLVLPVVADDSSRRAIQNAFALVYGQRLPSPICEQFTFREPTYGGVA
jgi:hypothetical protein